jgi:hypothetical protein
MDNNKEKVIKSTRYEIKVQLGASNALFNWISIPCGKMVICKLIRFTIKMAETTLLYLIIFSLK